MTIKEIFVKKKRTVKSLDIIKNKCIGCESCVERCRHQVLGMTYREGRSFATVEAIDRCRGCGKCHDICPAKAIVLLTAQIY